MEETFDMVIKDIPKKYEKEILEEIIYPLTIKKMINVNKVYMRYNKK